MPRRGKILSRGRRRSARRGAARRGWLLLTRGRRARDRQVWFIDHFGNELTTLAPHSKQVNGLSIDDTGCFVARRVVTSSRRRVVVSSRGAVSPPPPAQLAGVATPSQRGRLACQNKPKLRARVRRPASHMTQPNPKPRARTFVRPSVASCSDC